MAIAIDYQTGVLWQDTQHKEWISFFEKLEDAVQKNQGHTVFDPVISLKLIEEMTTWIYSHIMENDKKLGRFILEKERNRHV